MAARRFAAALVAEGEDMSPAERVVLTRALHHQLELAVRELGIVEHPDDRPHAEPGGATEVRARTSF